MSVIVNDDNHVKEGAATEEADGSATEGTVSVGARQGTYYYAFGDKASDANFQAPQRITKEEALKKEIDMKAGVSKWNANNYHWEEKNLMPWAEAFLSELYASKSSFPGLKKGTAKATKVTLDSGYAAVNVRKAKNIVTYDLHITFHWEGKYENTDVKGTIKWPQAFSQDQFIENGSEGDTSTIIDPKKAIVQSEPSSVPENCNMDRLLRRSKLVEKQVKKVFTSVICEQVLPLFFKEIMVQS
eukprot:g5697.t1